MRAARLALCCVAAASAKIGRIAAHGFVKGGQYRSAPLGRGTEAERAALEAARAAKAELDAENRLRRDSHRSWERRDNGTDRANATGGRAGAAADAIILEFPKSGRTWLFGLLTEAARLKGGRNFTVLRSHTMGVIDHPFLMSPDALAAAKTGLLVRDPLDVLVSSYFERVYRAKGSKAIPRHVQLKAFVEWTTGSIATHVAFLNAWVPAALAAPDRAVVVTYEGLSACAPRRAARGRAPRRRRAHATPPPPPPDRRPAPRKDHPTDAKHVEESSKFRAGKSHGAHEAITAHVYAKARRALEALDPVVRDVFQRAAAPCFVFNDTGPAKRQWCHASVMSTQELVCD
ncbi:hypothetical protein AURANDRAFT_62889 [Aureococcus anophagefferens]|uniref:Sulfotransferase domain-containing protein n=1 Tax=Aureococcus anophagefferens TaxID=44056 RepID=F0Y3F8_AURAN|nr:hypothetical protein AURANDRAFT_62889 [Aureococcus anophagefferens]EGB10255.1 hypothetical protein AURANDRAFT_62889 [Aureococcus anophagefferens]|eukprot:XP_009035070.1 hypothetical protein AURANDRAFT_62889 [Aureococcus anophagefferens]